MSQETRVKSAVRRDETIVRAGGQGDCFHMTWSADGRQLVAVNDGVGFIPRSNYNNRLWAVRGVPESLTFEDVPAYPDLIQWSKAQPQRPRYYGFGNLALDGCIYQFLSTWNHALFDEEDRALPDLRWVGVKLICSADNGRSWCNQDGTTPVVWEAWDQRSRESMVFFEEDQDAFSMLSVLQMGRDYALNQDGYVYVYAPNGNTEGAMNELVMFRVPKNRIAERCAYEFFAGRSEKGKAIWAKDLSERAVVHTFPSGWVGSRVHAWSWSPSVTYNAALDLYMLVNWGTGNSADGMWFTKPSYLGLWVAATPWGPWRQILEETAWTPGGDLAARAYMPQIAPGWVSPDGRSFWLVWTDYQALNRHTESNGNSSWADLWRTIDEAQHLKDRAQRSAIEAGAARAMMGWGRDNQPYYSFNTQRVDLVTT